MKEISVQRLPFSTIFKISYVSALASAIIAVALIGIVRLFVAFPQNEFSNAPIVVHIIIWLFYLVIGPLLSVLGLSVAGWLAVELLARMGWIHFRIVTKEVEGMADQVSHRERP